MSAFWSKDADDASIWPSRRDIPSVGTFNMADLKAVKRGDHWRIQMSWPDRMPRFFGEFESEAEAAHWIKEHSWLAPDKSSRQRKLTPSKLDQS